MHNMHGKNVISLHFTWLDSGQWALESTFRSGDGKYTEAVGIQNREIQTLVVGNGCTGLKMVEMLENHCFLIFRLILLHASYM